MTTVLFFSATLLLASLLSDLAGRTVLSLSVLFLIVGFVCGAVGVFHLEQLGPREPILGDLAEAALIGVLYTDASRSDLSDLLKAWRLPGRALFFGMPLTVGFLACIAHWLAALPWSSALLIGAILSPTDPVFASSLVTSEKVPRYLRHLLNIESGLNDGLALPAVVLLMGELVPGGPTALQVVLNLAIGVGVGIAIPWIIVRLEQTRFFAASHLYVPLLGFSVILLVFAVTRFLHGNEFLAAFVAGLTVASSKSKIKERFFLFSESLAEVFKMMALFLFGALISLPLLESLSWGEIGFALLAIFLVRPLAMGIALLDSGLSRRERAVVGWFGPKGFASVVFGLLVLDSRIANRVYLFHLVSIVVAGSIIVLSSTDLLAARWIGPREKPGEGKPPERHSA